jgi:hypothetical protein
MTTFLYSAKKATEKLANERIANASLELLFMCIIAIITCLIGSNYQQIIHIIIAFFIFLLIYIAIIKALEANPPFQGRFKNEEQAKSKIMELLKNTERSMDILSKVGTTIFDLFDEYVTLLQKNVKTTVVLIDPTDEELLKLINKMFFQTKKASSNHDEKLDNLIKSIIKKTSLLFETGAITEEEHSKLIYLLNTAREKGYKTLIEASKLMWEMALKKANEKFASTGNNYTLNTLEIYYCSSLPDIKAWISDRDKGAIGNYDALNIGRDNPIDFYKPRNENDLESCQFRNILDVWDYKIDSNYSRKVFP